MGKKLSDLPIGAKVVDPDTKYYGKPIVWLVADKNHEGYPANSVTLISEKILCLKCFDAKEPDNNIDYMNEYGNNRYIYSNIHSWLNSDLHIWYLSKHYRDSPPDEEHVGYSKPYNPYLKESGFLTNFSKKFKDSLMLTTLKVAKNYAEGGGYEDVAAKIFLASVAETGLWDQYKPSEGSVLSIFKDSTRRTGYLTEEAVINSTPKSPNIQSPREWRWWLRTSMLDSRYNSIVVNYLTDPLIGCLVFDGENGIRPLCNISSSIEISANSDSDGVYRFNCEPTITTELGGNLGIKSEPFSFSYSVNDEDTGQTITIKEYIDGKQKRSFTAERNKSYFFEITKEEWQELLNANHILKITVEDSNGGKTEKTFTFSKNETKIEFELKTPLKSDDRITKALINVSAEIPKGAAITVEACNNAFDEEPAWEDMTTRVKKGSKLFFKNEDKTSEKWGFNVRVKVNRSGATGECYIRSIGGNFE